MPLEIWRWCYLIRTGTSSCLYSKRFFDVDLTINNNQANQISKTIFISPALNITFAGTPLPGDTINFSVNDTVSTYLWNFGDGNTSISATPNHIYSDTGSFAVTLVVDNDTAQTLHTTIRIYKDPIYTHLITGTRVWRVAEFLQWGPPAPDTTLYFNTSIPI